MPKVSMHTANVVGPGEVPVERVKLTIAPAYAFVDGTTINWPVPVSVDLVDGEATIGGMETEYLGEPLVWAIRLDFYVARGQYPISYPATKIFPDGATGTIEYSDMIDVDAIAIPGYGPTWAEQARADAEAAEVSRVAAAAAQAAAEAVPLSNDTIIAGRVNTPGSATDAALKAGFVTLKAAAKNPDLLIVGGITRNGADVITSASVIWPDGTAGTFTTDAIDASGAINGYHITRGAQTFTQPTMTRNANGAVTNLPQIVVS